ncbi:hypothetical protein MPTK1_5g18350 [Marchantia polymorpha subsp. ruderalis]|uniref:GCK domain-containing protein n=2 Tax=Marchantia polymorpha TaxID=3197 RepID=A0AAF6BJP9_MARPO|nr:hypothetical protein MARPO_0084s0083 [Marchantia polymorpha]BBN12233.1 hypothetical protein Mp_5g18350 [Marchantia polymorpha subsp. ruderalis]|eukprot:PTQ34021.1 hypothetical protein MARPO_0084s0083 [Marchantia polymorpha]
MAAEPVKIEVLGISTDIVGDDENGLSVVDSSRASKLELVAEDGESARVILKDVEFENSDDSTASAAAQDGVGVADEADGGAEQRAEGAKSDSDSPALEEEEQEECGFCLFMKGGPCGERFSIWQTCVDGAEKSGEDIVEKCAQTTSLLKVCMEMNLEYYGPVLEAERAMEEVAAQDENQTSDSTEKPAATGGSDGKEDAQPESTGKVVEIVAVTAVDGEVTEVVDVVAQAAD